ncbi:MAG: hypothetical protein AAB152_10270 [Candidatus Coatesbacteria bacterium]
MGYGDAAKKLRYGYAFLRRRLVHVNLQVGYACNFSRDNFAAMICNGWFVTPEIAKALFSAGMYEISISVDYADPAKHDAQRACPGAFDRAIRALRLLNEARVDPEQRVHMISVVSEGEYHRQDEDLRTCVQPWTRQLPEGWQVRGAPLC